MGTRIPNNLALKGPSSLTGHQPLGKIPGTSSCQLKPVIYSGRYKQILRVSGHMILLNLNQNHLLRNSFIIVAPEGKLFVLDLLAHTKRELITLEPLVALFCLNIKNLDFVILIGHSSKSVKPKLVV